MAEVIRVDFRLQENAKFKNENMVAYLSRLEKEDPAAYHDYVLRAQALCNRVADSDPELEHLRTEPLNEFEKRRGEKLLDETIDNLLTSFECL